jgi:hypothetical protein
MGPIEASGSPARASDTIAAMTITSRLVHLVIIDVSPYCLCVLPDTELCSDFTPLAALGIAKIRCDALLCLGGYN